MARIIRISEEKPKEEPLGEYKEQVKGGVLNPHPYDRLMIHYRKNKEYGEELKVIQKAIQTFRKFYLKLQSSTNKSKRSKIAELSKKINKSTGLVDKKGNEIYLPEPLPRWIKRKLITEQKLAKSKKK